MSLSGKTAVVVGGAGGIGTELCKHLLRAGLSKLAILDLKELTSDKKNEIDAIESESKIFFEKCDISHKANMENVLWHRVLPKLEHIDIFINSAGVADERDPERLIAVNLTGTIDCSIMAMELMSLTTPGGRGGIIVNICSIAGLNPLPYKSIYVASKYGLMGFTRSLGASQVFDQTGVKFITICPGGTDTDLLKPLLNGENLFFPWMKEEIVQVAQSFPVQSPQAVGGCLIQAIEDGQNGSLWTCIAGNVCKVELPEINRNYVQQTYCGSHSE